MDHINNLLNWLMDLKFVDTVLNRKQALGKVIVFGGIMRTIIETKNMSFEDSKEHIMKYIKNGGDIDVVADRDDLYPDIRKLLNTRKMRSPEFKHKTYEYDRNVRNIIKQINQEEDIEIVDISHNNDNYFVREVARKKFNHFHAKITGMIEHNGQKIPIAVDLTEYGRGDDKLSNLNYDFSTNMLRALWTNDTWQIDSRYDGLAVDQIMSDIALKKYNVIGGRRHIGNHRYYRMVQRGYWPKDEKDIEIFIEHSLDVFGARMNKDILVEIIKYMFENETSLKKHINTNHDVYGYILTGIFMVLDIPEMEPYLAKYFDLFEKRPTICYYSIHRFLEYANPKTLTYVETRADMTFDRDTHGSNNVVYGQIQTVEVLDYVMKRCKMDKNQLSILAGKTHALFLRGLESNEHLLDPLNCMKTAIEHGNFETAEYLHAKYPTLIGQIMNGFIYLPDEFNPNMAKLIMKVSNNKSTAYKLIKRYPLCPELVKIVGEAVSIDSFMMETIISNALHAMEKDDYPKVRMVVYEVASAIDKSTMSDMYHYLTKLDHEKAEDLYYSIPRELKTRY